MKKPSKDRNAHPTYPLISKLLSDALGYELNAIDFNSIKEIELLQNYQSTDSADDGEIQKLLDKRLQEALANADNGSKESFGKQKSLRSQFMANLAQNVQFLFVELLLILTIKYKNTKLAHEHVLLDFLITICTSSRSIIANIQYHIPTLMSYTLLVIIYYRCLYFDILKQICSAFDINNLFVIFHETNYPFKNRRYLSKVCYRQL
ncbi:hypothetical protein RFI_31306 [Reticulomyxa filosa]|uniref:Uncharacterized protein n=1 Tax=Reticulomyxa filosa TaxID=46433 RepID=X6LY60_RETFI|nr:hypothetical protein RFI_31306 [Reticulomyxa filosa]|eukprot:ETO06092.1 hypothetical protein RFI_31306 [Reticulomyxa filosa]